MLAPIIRLLAIYLAVGLAVFAFFKRDALMAMFADDNAAPTEQSAPVSTNPEEAAAPAAASELVYAPLPPEGDATASTEALQAPTVPAETETSATLEQGRDAARRAYWQGDTTAAIAQYRKILAQYPDDESLNGELGNLYYMNGQRAEAAGAYEKAGLAAVKAGHNQQAQMLLSVLQSLDGEAAGRLNSAMGAAQ